MYDRDLGIPEDSMGGEKVHLHTPKAGEQPLLFLPPLTIPQMQVLSTTMLAALFAWYPRLWMAEEETETAHLLFAQVLLSAADTALMRLGEEEARELKQKFAQTVLNMFAAQGKEPSEVVERIKERLEMLGFTAGIDEALLKEVTDALHPPAPAGNAVADESPISGAENGPSEGVVGGEVSDVQSGVPGSGGQQDPAVPKV